MKKLPAKVLEPISEAITGAVNKAGSIVESIRILGEISRDMKELRREVGEIKAYLARQEEIARVMIEQGNILDEDDLLIQDDDVDDKDKKDMN